MLRRCALWPCWASSSPSLLDRRRPSRTGSCSRLPGPRDHRWDQSRRSSFRPRSPQQLTTAPLRSQAAPPQTAPPLPPGNVGLLPRFLRGEQGLVLNSPIDPAHFITPLQSVGLYVGRVGEFSSFVEHHEESETDPTLTYRLVTHSLPQGPGRTGASKRPTRAEGGRSTNFCFVRVTRSLGVQAGQ